MIYVGYSYFTMWLFPTWLLESTTSMFVFLVFFLWFYGLMSGCSFEHLYLVGPSILQWLKWLFGSLHWFVVVAMFLSSPFLFFLLGSILVAFLFGTTWLSFSHVHILHILFLQTSLINYHGFKGRHLPP